jgi:2-hydroxychromene-2-carboxylate isomerase
MQNGPETGSEPNVSSSLRDIGQDPSRVMALASGPAANDALLSETDAARQLGIFGSPTFVVGRELFWGDDRMGDAMSWLKYGVVRRS